MEVCVDCLNSAKEAEAGGASRLELCSALSEGGLTPSVGMLQTVKSLVKIPVFVMIRPRRGIDFVYSDEEVNVMELDINCLKSAGADGFVFGLLLPSRKVNKSACHKLLCAAAPLPCTFHRAFDVLQDPLLQLKTIIDLGFKRVLTSGQKDSACNGVKLIKNLVDTSRDRISIMAGAGISEENLEFILKETGVKEFHASARSPVVVLDTKGFETIAIGTSDFDSLLLVTNKALVESMVKISKTVWNASSLV